MQPTWRGELAVSPHFARIPSFSWGGAQGVKDYNFEKAISVAEKVMARRGVKLTDSYVSMLRAVRDITYAMK